MFSTNYAPEHSGIGPYAAQTAEHLAALRAEVHVLAGMPHYPAWRVHDDYRGRWRAEEVRRGVHLHRRRHYVPSRQTALLRAMYEASFLAHGWFRPPSVRPDIVLSQMPSLAGAVLGARCAHRHEVPHVVVVQDLMGAAAAQSGISGGRRVAFLVAGAEARVLRSAALVGVVHESFVKPVSAIGVPASRIRVVPNWTHVSCPTGDRSAVREELGWHRDEVVVLHSGSMGLKQGLEVLVDAARITVGDTPRIRFVLMGDGNQRSRLERLAEGLPNLDVVPPAKDEKFPDVLAAADLLAVTQRASVRDMSLPSKLTSYFAAGRPVIAAVTAQGGTAQEVRRSGAGVVVEPENPRALLDAVRQLSFERDRSAALGAHGPEYVRERLGREAGLMRIAALLGEALKTKASRSRAAAVG
ncbi:glycosyltransferase [Streptomyces sp. NPDC003758]